MKITYAFADGTTSVVEVDDEIGAYIMDSRRQENNDDRRHRYHNYSLDDVTYEGSEYGRCDVYSFDNESEELAAHVRDAFSHLTDAQRRRLLMSSKGMSLREIAAAEGTSHLAIYHSIEEGRHQSISLMKMLMQSSTASLAMVSCRIMSKLRRTRISLPIRPKRSAVETMVFSKAHR